MPPTEVCLIHPGGLSSSSWSRLASHLPAGTPVRMLALEAINGYWAGDPSLTVETLADRLRPRLAVPRHRLLVGWGVGGAVADALRGPEQHVVVLDGLAPGAPEPGECELLRSFAMYVGARRGVALTVDSARLREGLDGVLRVAITARALRADATAASVRRSYQAHVTRVLRDHRLTASHVPSGRPLTVVKAANSLAPDSRALGWDRFGPVEALASGGDHYSMLTAPAPAAHLAMMLQRWLAPPVSAAA